MEYVGNVQLDMMNNSCFYGYIHIVVYTTQIATARKRIAVSRTKPKCAVTPVLPCLFIWFRCTQNLDLHCLRRCGRQDSFPAYASTQVFKTQSFPCEDERTGTPP